MSSDQTPMERAVDGIVEYFRPNPLSGWDGVPWFDESRAQEMLIFLWDEYGIDVKRWSEGRRPTHVKVDGEASGPTLPPKAVPES